jgi:hypothetical protein
MGIRGPMPEISRIPELADLSRTSGFVQNSEEIFSKVEVSKMALVHS